MKNYNLKTNLFSLVILLLILFLSPVIVLANDSPLNDSIVVSQAAFRSDVASAGQALNFFDQEFRLTAGAGVLKSSLVVTAKKLTAPFNWPWNFKPLTPVYEFDLDNWQAAYDRSRPLVVEITYPETNDYYKQIFFLDGTTGRWRPLPSTDDPVKKVVRANIHLPFSRLAVLASPQVMTVGQASWYRFKNGLFAASPDFPRGSVVRVHNLANGKFVDVTINDYGPDRAIHPDRAIDLDLVAFERIASAADGIIKVKVEPRHIALAANDYIFTAGGSLPEINSKSAIIIAEDDGQILFNKNSDQAAPLASLTKILAARVFLDTGTDLNKVVTYSVKDEEYNHQYVAAWESARLRLNDGETLRVKDLLNVTLIGSTNNTTETLIRASGLSREEFIARMNVYAEVWGASQTKFVEPTGLSKDNISSPYDYAIIMREAFRHPLLASISNTSSYSFSTINTKRAFRVSNTSSLVRSGKWSLLGSKTGFIDASGYCLMSRLQTPQGNLIIVSFNASNRDISFNDHERLIIYGQQ